MPSRRRERPRNDLAAIKLQLSELEDAKKQLFELNTLREQVKKLQQKPAEEGERTNKALSEAHSAGFEEAKEKIIEHYKGQVAEIKNSGFRRGARIFYFRGITKGYGLGLDAASINTEFDLHAVPAIELPKIDIPPKEEDEEEGEEKEEVDEGNAEGRSVVGDEELPKAT